MISQLINLLLTTVSLMLIFSLAGDTALQRRAAALTAGVTSRPTNIVLIVTDDQDSLLGSLDAMPYTQALLADQGVSFSNFYAPLPLCCPARASLLTGQHAHTHRIFNNEPPGGGYETFLANGLEDATIGVTLQEAGFQTALIGKYLNGYPRPGHSTYAPPGWNEWFVPIDSNAYGSLNYTVNDNGVLVSYGNSQADYLSDVLAGQALDFINHTSIVSPTIPFFAAITFYAPHDPAMPATRHRNEFPDAQVPRTPAFNEGNISDKPPHISQQPLLTSGEIAAIDDLYRRKLRSLQAVDEFVAQLVRSLARLHQLDNTYIIFTSDNGFHMGQHRFLPGKGRPYEEDLLVPLIVRGPDVPAGLVRDELASLIDLAPTLAAIAETELPRPADGRSLLPLLSTADPPATWRQALLAEHYPLQTAQAGGSSGTAPFSSLLAAPQSVQDRPDADFLVIRTRTYKYIERGTYAYELYDLVHDPYELRNQIDNADPAFLAQLNAWAASYHACADATCRVQDALTPPRLAIQRSFFLPIQLRDS